jgi:hypothetical protein
MRFLFQDSLAYGHAALALDRIPNQGFNATHHPGKFEHNLRRRTSSFYFAVFWILLLASAASSTINHFTPKFSISPAPPQFHFFPFRPLRRII